MLSKLINRIMVKQHGQTPKALQQLSVHLLLLLKQHNITSQQHAFDIELMYMPRIWVLLLQGLFSYPALRTLIDQNEIHVGYGYYRPKVYSFDPGWKGGQAKGPEDEGIADLGNDPLGIIERHTTSSQIPAPDSCSPAVLWQLAKLQRPLH